jgi:hypothetical protein
MSTSRAGRGQVLQRLPAEIARIAQTRAPKRITGR